MTDSVKTKSVNLEDLQSFSKVLFNKGIGNKGICSTAGATADKEVNFGTTYSLVDGAMAVVRFTYGIGAANATLRVNSQVDANEEPVRKPIYYKNAPVPAGLIKAGTTLLLKYENSNNNRWVIIGEYYDTMGGADGTNAGASGLVPAPTATDNNKFLRGDGTWAEVSGGGGGSDFYTPTLANAPTSSDTTYTKDGNTESFVIGQFCRVADNTMDTGYKFYQLHDLQSNGTVAVWQEMGTPLERLSLSVTSNQPALLTSLRSSAVVTVTDEDDNQVFSGTLPQARTLKLTPAKSYSISAASVSGYATPDAVTDHEAEYEGVSAVSMEYLTEVLTVVLSTDNGTPDFSGVTITVTDTTTSSTVSAQQNGTYLIPSGHTYTVSVSDDVDGYSAPDTTESYTAASTANASRTVTMVYTEGMKGVDLGLPSGLLWAPMNIGAEAPEEYGDYFSWGNTDGHAQNSGYNFNDDNYNSSSGKTLYDSLASGASYSPDSGNDAARENVGQNWRLPTRSEVQELVNNTDHEWVSNYNSTGVAGIKIMKKTDNSVYIFIPAGGASTENGNSRLNTEVRNWTSSRSSSPSAYMLYATDSLYEDSSTTTKFGLPIRAVSYLSYQTTIHVTTTDGSSNAGISLTITDKEGSHTVTTDSNGDATLLLTAGTCTITSATRVLNVNQITVSSAGTVNISSSAAITFGYIILNQNSTDPTQKVVDMDGHTYSNYTTPAVITAIRNNSHCYVGTFDSTNNVMSLKQLDDSDGTMYADGTSAASDIASTDHDVFMRLPEFYTKATEITSISNHTASAGSTIWKIEFAYGGNPGTGWKQWGGNDLIGKYEAYVSGNKMYSISGKNPSSYISQADCYSYARANGTGFTIVKWRHQNIMAILFYAYYGHTNCQLLIGSGIASNDKQAGLKNSLGMTDTTSSNGNTNNIVFWGLENWWGNKYEWIDNVVINNHTWTITEDDGTTRTIQASAMSSVNDSWFFPSKFIIGDNLDTIAVAGQSGGSSSQGYCDGQFYTSTNSRVVARSEINNTEYGGVAYVNASNSSSVAVTYGGSRLAYTGDIAIV